MWGKDKQIVSDNDLFCVAHSKNLIITFPDLCENVSGMVHPNVLSMHIFLYS